MKLINEFISSQNIIHIPDMNSSGDKKDMNEKEDNEENEEDKNENKEDSESETKSLSSDDNIVQNAKQLLPDEDEDNIPKNKKKNYIMKIK